MSKMEGAIADPKFVKTSNERAHLVTQNSVKKKKMDKTEGQFFYKNASNSWVRSQGGF
jgi:hypothetical protein